MERVLEELEHRCHENMTHAVETEEGLGIEYDEDVVCDVCQSPDGEDNNEMVFCDKCNICVHQVSLSDRTCLLLVEEEELVSSSRSFILAPKLLSAVILVLLQTEVQRLPPPPPQACYGIQKVPKGSWLCRICALGILPKCQLCPKKGGAMKPTRSGTKWVHVSCALWIPEVKPERCSHQFVCIYSSVLNSTAIVCSSFPWKTC